MSDGVIRWEDPPPRRKPDPVDWAGEHRVYARYVGDSTKDGSDE